MQSPIAYGFSFEPKMDSQRNYNSCTTKQSDQFVVVSKNSFLHITPRQGDEKRSSSMSCPGLPASSDGSTIVWGSEMEAYFRATQCSSGCHTPDSGAHFLPQDERCTRESIGSSKSIHRVLSLEDIQRESAKLNWCEYELDNFTTKGGAAKRGPAHSAGSINHSIGECVPCAFYYSEKTCVSGVECKFCHLCPVGEFKRQKKGKNSASAKEKRNQEANVATKGSSIRGSPKNKAGFKNDSEAANPFTGGNFCLMSALGFGGRDSLKREASTRASTGGKVSKNAERMRNRRREQNQIKQC